jgi:hypothetical protein
MKNKFTCPLLTASSSFEKKKTIVCLKSREIQMSRQQPSQYINILNCECSVIHKIYLYFLKNKKTYRFLVKIS